MKSVRLKYYGWLICLACTLNLLCNSGLTITGFNVYPPYLIKLSGLTNTQSSSLSMIRSLFSVLGMTVNGPILAALGYRATAAAAVFCVAGGFILQAFVGNYFGYALASAIFGLTYGIGGIIVVSVVITRWFNKHRGLALGICMAATGLSSVLSSNTVPHLIERYSLATAFWVEGIFCALCGLVNLIVIRDNPSDIGAPPIGEGEELRAEKVYADKDAPAMYLNLMIFGLTVFGMAFVNVTTHVSVLYRTEGFPQESVTLILSVMGICLAGGKCIYGMIADRIGVFRASRLFYILFTVGTGLCCLAFNGSTVIGVFAIAMMSVGLASATVSSPMYASGAVTEANYAKMLTKFQTFHTVGGLIFGTVPGIIADITGTYVPAFVIMTAFGVFSTVLLQITYYKILKFQKSDIS